MSLEQLKLPVKFCTQVDYTECLPWDDKLPSILSAETVLANVDSDLLIIHIGLCW